MLVDDVFQYRTLMGKCDLGVGLDWDEIEQITAIESAFEPTADARLRFRSEMTEHGTLSALMRGDKINDHVEVVEIGPAGIVVRNAPFVAHGDLVEIVLDHGDKSYRFSARCLWLNDDGDDYRVGLALIGMPVCIHTVVVSRHEADVVDRIAVAAAA